MPQRDRRAPPRSPALVQALCQLQAQARGGKLLKAITWFWLAAITTLIADLASKYLAFQALGGGPPPGNLYTENHVIWILPGAFRLICHYNTGGAFGWASGKILLFLAATAVLVPALVLTAYHCREPNAPVWGLGLIVGGAIGNLYDRLFHVGVRDFLEITNPRTGSGMWPVFNVADIAIVVGVVIYLVWSILDSVRKRKPAAGEQEREESHG